MTFGLHVRVVNKVDGHVLDRDYPSFPVVIGRSPDSELQLEHEFVSLSHAQLDYEDGQVVLRDLGSTNGTHVPGLGRIEPDQPVALTQYGNRFIIHVLDVRVELANECDQETAASRRWPMEVSKFIMSAPHGVPMRAGAANFSASDSLRAQFASYRAAWAEFFSEVFRALSNLPHEQRAQALSEVRSQFPGIEHESDFARLVASIKGATADSAPVWSTSHQLEAAAVEGLRELARGFCPSAGPLETADNAAQFLEHLQEVLKVFFEKFVQLRNGHQKFEIDLALTAANRTHVKQSSTRIAVESATTAQELSAALLDWHSASSDGAEAVQATFEDVMARQIALINGVMEGAKSLLHDLSPAEVERLASNGKICISPFRFKRFWKAYELQHGDMAGDEKQIFSRLFGKEFAQAYGKGF